MSIVDVVRKAPPMTVRNESTSRARIRATPRFCSTGPPENTIGLCRAPGNFVIDYRTLVRYNLLHAYRTPASNPGLHQPVRRGKRISAVGSRDRTAIQHLSGDRARPYLSAGTEGLSPEEAISIADALRFSAFAPRGERGQSRHSDNRTSCRRYAATCTGEHRRHDPTS